MSRGLIVALSVVHCGAAPRPGLLHCGRLGLLVCVVASLLAAVPVSARAADYLTDRDGNKISLANLDGSVGGDLAITGATVYRPRGVVVAPATGRIYWANSGGNKISFARLDGSDQTVPRSPRPPYAKVVGVDADLPENRVRERARRPNEPRTPPRWSRPNGATSGFNGCRRRASCLPRINGGQPAQPVAAPSRADTANLSGVRQTVAPVCERLELVTGGSDGDG